MRVRHLLGALAGQRRAPDLARAAAGRGGDVGQHARGHLLVRGAAHVLRLPQAVERPLLRVPRGSPSPMATEVGRSICSGQAFA